MKKMNKININLCKNYAAQTLLLGLVKHDKGAIIFMGRVKARFICWGRVIF